MSPRRNARRGRSGREARLLDLAEQLLPSGVRNVSTSPAYAMVIKEARGSRLVDQSDNEYIDYLLGSGPMLLGHSHPSVVEAVRRQLERGSSYLMVSEPTIRLAEAIVATVPCAEMVSFHSSGSESTFFAIRLARAYRQRSRVLKFEGGFHGMGDHSLMSNQWTFDPADFPKAVPNSAGIPSSVADEVLVAPFNDLETTGRLIEAHADELACVIVEPMQRTIPPQPGFLEGLRQLTLDHGILMIFDEVVTGFRLALGGAQERYGVRPDLCALGKSISAGHPLGVLCGSAEIMALLRPGRGASRNPVLATGTYSGNPVSATAALASIAELRKPGCYERLEARGRRLMNALQEMLDGAGIQATVTGEPSAFEPWFTAEPIVDHRSILTADSRMRRRFVELLLDRGVVKAHEKFFVSMAHTDEDIDLTLEAFRGVVEELETLKEYTDG